MPSGADVMHMEVSDCGWHGKKTFRSGWRSLAKQSRGLIAGLNSWRVGRVEIVGNNENCNAEGNAMNDSWPCYWAAAGFPIELA